MKIVSTSGRGNFQIEKSGLRLLELKYTNWFSSRASTKLNGIPIEIRAKNMWQSKFDILKGGEDCGDIIFNWKGQIIIRLESGTPEREENYLLKAKGTWKMHYELLDENEEIVLVIKPNMNWQKLNYNYEIHHVREHMDEPKLMELLIYCGFGANLHLSSTT